MRLSVSTSVASRGVSPWFCSPRYGHTHLNPLNTPNMNSPGPRVEHGGRHQLIGTTCFISECGLAPSSFARHRGTFFRVRVFSLGFFLLDCVPASILDVYHWKLHAPNRLRSCTSRHLNFVNLCLVYTSSCFCSPRYAHTHLTLPERTS